MAYVTGNFSSMATLKAGIETACTDNGWALTNGILNKDGCFAQLAVFSSIGVDSHLSIITGNGMSGSALTDPAPYTCSLGPLRTGYNVNTLDPWTWPAIYHVHINENPDEVWVFINYNGTFFQWLAFGKSPAPGNAGTGNWHSGFMPGSGLAVSYHVGAPKSRAIGTSTRGQSNQASITTMPFFFDSGPNGTGYNAQNGCVHGVIDETTGLPRWSVNQADSATAYAAHIVGAFKANIPLFGIIPSAWNNEAVLLPIIVNQQRPSAKVSIINIMQHARLTRNNFIPAGEILTLGLDRWKVYPTYRRNPDFTGDSPDGTSPGWDHSGTFAMAVRYDGP